MSNSGGLAALGAYSHYLGSIHCSLSINDTALLLCASGLNVLSCYVQTLNDHLALLGGYCKYLALLALVLPVALYLPIRILPAGLWRFLLVCALSVVVSAAVSYAFVLNGDEKDIVSNLIGKKLLHR